MSQEKKTIVVTGGTKGIGRAIVERFAKEKWNVITCARNLEDLNNLKKDVENEFGEAIHVFKADLSKKEDVNAFAEEINHLNISIDVLVNNAGKYLPGLVHEEPEGTLEEMMDTNLYSAYHLSRKIVPKMKAQKNGHVFNVCSVASLIAYPNGGSYSISKFAMYGFSKALREEMKEYGVRVTSLMPGAVLTPSWDGVDLPNERFIKPEDIAETIYATYQLSERTVVEDIVIRPQLGDI